MEKSGNEIKESKISNKEQISLREKHLYILFVV